MRIVIAAICFVLIGGCPLPALEGEADPGQNPSALSPQTSTARSACATPQHSFPEMTAATYAIIAEYTAEPVAPEGEPADGDTAGGDGAEPTGDGLVLPRFIGTGFAISPYMIATNAHVAEAITADGPLPLRRVVAVQSGTGRVIRLTHAIEHPAYNGSPLASADVAILLPHEALDSYLLLATAGSEGGVDGGDDRGHASDAEGGQSDSADADVDGAAFSGATSAPGDALQLGAEIALIGFPGDVVRLIDIIPGVTVPQATALVGSITSRRSFNPNAVVTDATVDFIQHQAPTTPGMSGSPIVACGEVVAVNNAGTMKLVVSVDPETGEPTVDRQADAANNFGVHVKYLREIIPLVQDGHLPGAALP